MKVYLDYGATSFKKPQECFNELQDFYNNNNCNPGRGGYELALDSSRMIFKLRENIKRLFHCSESKQVVFTKNVTEALNTVIKGLVKQGDHVLISSIEHNSVYRVVDKLAKEGIITYSIIPISKEGVFPIEEFDKYVTKDTRMCVINHISNVSGHIMPLEEIDEKCREKGLYLVVDGAQSAGALEIDLEKLSKKTIYTFTGHKKLMGPMGTGGFILEEELALEMETLIEGGTGSESFDAKMPDFMPDRFEAGTINGLGLAGLSGSIKYLLSQDLNGNFTREKRLHQELFQGLMKLPGISFYGDLTVVKAGVISFNMEGIDNGELAFILDDTYGIMARSGLHCSPLAHKTFGNLTGSLRFSLGHSTTEDEIEYVLSSMRKIALK